MTDTMTRLTGKEIRIDIKEVRRLIPGPVFVDGLMNVSAGGRASAVLWLP